MSTTLLYGFTRNLMYAAEKAVHLRKASCQGIQCYAGILGANIFQ